MYYQNKVMIGYANGEPVCIEPSMANRHGLIAGATGTGKTVTLKVMAESFSDAGVPVFMADVKGDLAGTCSEGTMSDAIRKRLESAGIAAEDFPMKSYPVKFWDIYGELGIPVRTTVSQMGPVLLTKLMELNATQADILTVLFSIADEEGLLLLDLKDLKALIQYVMEHTDEYSKEYGNMAKASLTAILRHVTALDAKGGNSFFTEPSLDLTDWFTCAPDGRGIIHILESSKLINDPTLYSVFLLWLMSELFEALPEVGDLEKPKMVFFFDEAHLLFNNISKSLQEKLEQTVKLIRSKGIGLYFITQTPRDIPDGVLSQLGNKVEHALHAYTPADEKAVKAAAASFRANPAFDTKTAIMELGVGEALVSVLDAKGIPSVVQITTIMPPQSHMGPIDDTTRRNLILADDIYPKYKDIVDRESAYELLTQQAAGAAAAAEQAKIAAAEAKAQEKAAAAELKAQEKAAAAEARAQEKAAAAEAKAKEKAIQAAEREKEKKLAEIQKQIDKEKAAEEKAYQKMLAEQQKREQQEDARRQREVQNAYRNVAKTTAGTIGRELGGNLGKSIGGSFGGKLGRNLGSSLARNILGTFLR